MNSRLWLLPFLLTALLATPAFAAPGDAPNLIDVQGYLRTQAGLPVDGIVRLKVGLYDAADEGTLLYVETLPAVPVVSGRFSTLLGAISMMPAGLFGTYDEVYVGVSVDGGEELDRQRLVSVPYALHAATSKSAEAADTAGALSCEGCVRSTQLAPGSVGPAEMAPGSVDKAALAPASVGEDQLEDGAVTPEKIGARCNEGEVLKRRNRGWACAMDIDTFYVTVYRAGAGLELDEMDNTFSLADHGVGAAHIAPRAVGAAALDARSVGEAHFQDGAVRTDDLGDGAVTARKVGEACEDGEVLRYDGERWGCDALADVGRAYEAGAGLALRNREFSLAEEGVAAEHLAPGSVDSEALGEKSVGTAALQDDAITAAHLGEASVGFTEIQPGVIRNGHISAIAAIDPQKIAGRVALLTGDQAFDGNTLVVEADENRVGVGTSKPGATLHVAGDLIVNGSISYGETKTGQLLLPPAAFVPDHSYATRAEPPEVYYQVEAFGYSWARTADPCALNYPCRTVAHAAVPLPAGARVVSFVCFYKDASESDDFLEGSEVTVSAVRTSGEGGVVEIAKAEWAGENADPNIRSAFATAPFDDHVVDPLSYMYMAMVSLVVDANNPALQFRGCRLSYQVDGIVP